MGGKRQPITLKIPRGTVLTTNVPHPSEKAPFWELKKVVFPMRIIGYIMYHHLYSRNWHYVGDRTIPCLRSDGIDCTFHGQGGPRTQYYATVPFITDDSNIISLINLTDGAVRECQGVQERTDLLGCQICVWRMPGGPRRKMCCRISPKPHKEINPKMIVEHDELTRVLANIHGYKLEYVDRRPDLTGSPRPLEENPD